MQDSLGDQHAIKRVVVEFWQLGGVEGGFVVDRQAQNSVGLTMVWDEFRDGHADLESF